jgi:8-oxo-dGTP diphosphatase
MGIAVRALVRGADGRLLLIRRALDADSEPGCWDLPGGKLEHGEDAAEALAREAREETGLPVEVGRPVHVFSFLVEPVWVTCVAFACESPIDSVELSAEHDNFAWVDVSRPGRCDVPPDAWASGVQEQIEAYRALVGGL